MRSAAACSAYASVDLDDVVNQEHRDDLCDVERRIGFAQHQRKHAEMPGMLSGTLAAAAVGQR
jgi:hypothetical protein